MRVDTLETLALLKANQKLLKDNNIDLDEIGEEDKSSSSSGDDSSEYSEGENLEDDSSDEGEPGWDIIFTSWEPAGHFLTFHPK